MAVNEGMGRGKQENPDGDFNTRYVWPRNGRPGAPKWSANQEIHE